MNNKLTIIALLGIFILPPALSWYMFKYGDVQGGKRNHGQLIQPPKTLSDIELDDLAQASSKPLYGKWSLVFFNSGACAEECEEKLYKARQIRLAMSKYAHRLQRLMIIDTDNQELTKRISEEYSGQLVVNVERFNQQEFAGFRLGKDDDPFIKDYIFVVDPIGNLMMYYPADADPIGIIEDLHHLLKISRIG